MTIASEIVALGFREANFTGIAGSPSADEAAEGLVLLKNLVTSLFSNIANNKPVMWYVPSPSATDSTKANYPALSGDQGIKDVTHPPANTRLMMRNTASTTIYLQYAPQDGALMEYVDAGHTGDVILNGNGALFGLTGFTDTLTITKPDAVTRVAPRRWVYRGDWGSWVEITTLASATELPFPEHFDDYFVTAMAMRLAPRFGSSARPETMMRNRDMTVMIRQQYTQMKEQIGQGVLLSHQSYSTRLSNGDPDRGFV